MLNTPETNADAVTKLIARTGYVGAVWDHKVYLLLGDRPADSITSGSGWEIKSVNRSIDINGFPALTFALDDAGASRMKALTTDHQHQPLAIVINDRVVLVATIQTVINGEMMVSNMEEKKLDRVLGKFRESSIQLPVEILEIGRAHV